MDSVLFVSLVVLCERSNICGYYAFFVMDSVVRVLPGMARAFLYDTILIVIYIHNIL